MRSRRLIGKRATPLPVVEVSAWDDPFHEEGRPMRDSERGSAADGERSSVEGPNASGRRGSPRRWSVEQEARVVGERFRPGRRVEEVARRCGPTRSGSMDDDQAPPARRPWSGRRVAAPARVRRVDRTRGTTAQWPAPMPALALQERRGRAHREAAHWTVPSARSWVLRYSGRRDAALSRDSDIASMRSMTRAALAGARVSPMRW